MGKPTSPDKYTTPKMPKSYGDLNHHFLLALIML